MLKMLHIVLRVEKKQGICIWQEKYGKVVLIHNAIDTSLFCLKQTKRDELRKQLGLTDSFVLGHVGRYEIKGLKIRNLFGNIPASDKKDSIGTFVNVR